ncbi:MAG TPA: PAS domain S-box protein [Sandaracinaceae bacterium LLY-WYZ-13_1]|nr:PAS domain S-box protein [Sandaracinaceae bacterium LLY-WYZ-13_1]
MNAPSDRASASRTANDTLFEALLSSVPDAVAIVRSRKLWRVNEGLLRLFGYEPTDSLLGRSWTSLFVPEDRPGLLEAGTTGTPTPQLVRALRRDGSELPVEVRVSTHALPDADYLLAIVRDPAHRDAAERAIREQEALYRAIFEVNTAVKLLLEPGTGRIVDANHTAVQFYGWSLEQLRSMKIQDINTLTAEEIVAEMEHARARRRTYFRFRHRTARDELRHVEVHSGPIDLGGETLLLSIIHDVTERDALEEQLRRAQRLETVGRLAGGVAHDFNNLLTVMMTTCGLVGRELPPESPGCDYLRDLEHAARRGAELTQQLLAVGRRQVMREQRIDVRALVGEMEGLLHRTLGERIEVRVVLEDAPPVSADAGQLEQVLLNLALNARDAMPDGGRLTIRTGSVTLGPVDGRGLSPGPYASITVEDTGKGMDEHTRAHVFDPFFTTKPHGSGLGLSTAYGIVSQFRGELDVRSAPGEGSTFEMLLPAVRRRAPTPASTEAPPPPAPVVAGQRALVVEDAPDVRHAMRRALEGAGWNVQVAESAEAALSRSGAELGDLGAVVSDVRMPGMSGIDLAHALRRRRRDLPILLVTGNLEEHVHRTLPDDVGFLRKPFRGDELVEALAAAVARVEGG